MTPRRVALERFSAPAAAADAAAVEAEVEREIESTVPDEKEDQAEAAPPDSAEPARDAEAERNALIGRIAAALEAVAADQAALRSRCIESVAAALGGTAEELLPRLAREGFAALAAEAVETVARRGRWPHLELRAAAETAAEVQAALGDAAPSLRLEITPDAALGPGEVRLGWTGGGAEIDLETIAETALDRFRRALDAATARESAP